MAKGKILYSDVSDEDVYKLVRQSAAETLTVVNTLTDAIKSSAKGINAGSNGIGNKAEIDALTKSLEDVKRLTEELNILKAKAKEANLLLSKSYDQLSDAEKQVITDSVNISNIRKENLALTKEAIAQSKAEEGSLSQMRTSLNKLIKEYDAMGKARRESIKGTELLDKIKTETAAIYGLETASGRFQRNVGNYKSGYDGLANSINQLTREAPAAAVSMQTFFLAISNNLPQFTDEINKLKKANIELEATGKPTVSVLGAIGKAVFSWQSLISVGITLLTIYGGKLVDYIFNTKTATKATDEFANSIQDVNKRLAESNKELEKSNNIAVSGEDAGSELNRYAEFLRKKGEINLHYAKLESENRKRLDKESGYRRTDSDIATDLLFTPDKDLAEYLKRKKIIDEGKAKELKNVSIIFAQLEQKLSDDKEKARADKEKDHKEKQVKEREEKFKTFEEITLEEYNTEVQNTKDFYERQKNNADIDFLNGKISQQEYDKTIEQLKLDSLYRQFQNAVDYGQKTVYLEEQISAMKVDILKKQLAQEEKIRKDAILKGTDSGKEQAKKAAQFKDNEDKERIKKEQETLNTLQKQSDNYFSRKEKAADMEIQNAKDKQQTLALLAQRGVENAAENYAFEQKAQAEAEEKRLKLERNKMRSEFAISLLKAYSNNGGDLNKTLGDSAALIAAAQALPQFYEGTEDTGTVNKPLDKNGGRLAVIHDNERILNREQNMRLPKGLSNEDLVRQASLMPPSYHSTITRTNGIEKLESKLDSVVNAINNIEIPQQQLYWSEFEKGFIHTTKTRDRILNEHHIKRGLF